MAGVNVQLLPSMLIALTDEDSVGLCLGISTSAIRDLELRVATRDENQGTGLRP